MFKSKGGIVVFGIAIIMICMCFCMEVTEANINEFDATTKCGVKSANPNYVGSYHTHEECMAEEDDLFDDIDDTFKIIGNVAVSF
ncbi:hypothetical protein G2W53_018554 [Senna tora]|uniref:Uncharacterized protein n=1 Tax=Senna tora TaxID=362788 RepID=A0A834WL68_9FABA|nr:hypothetical protein G2W53_018554 [Senna tora]